MYYDEILYAKGAESFLHLADIIFQGNPINAYPPLYSIIISLAYLFKDPHTAYFAITLINAIILSMVIFPVWLLAKMFLNRNEALIVTILIAFFLPLNYVYIFVIMSENLFIPLIAFSIFFLIKSTLHSSLKYDALCGLLFGLSYLTKTAGLVLIPIYILCFGVYHLLKYRDGITDMKSDDDKFSFITRFLKDLFKKYLVFLIFTLTILPWYIRNVINFAPPMSTLFSKIIYGVTGRYGTYSDDVGIMNMWGSLSIFTFQEISKQFFLHLSYIILSLNVILFIFIGFFIVKMLSLKRLSIKNKQIILFSLSTLTLLLSFLIIVAIHVYLYNLAHLGVFQYLRARYVDSVIPVLIILGFIGISEFNKNKNSNTHFILPILISGLILLVTPPIFLTVPINTIMIQYLAKYTMFQYSVIIILAFLVTFFIVLFLKKINFYGIAAIFAILFIISSISAYSMVAWSSKTQYTSDQDEIISWINQKGFNETTLFIINNQTNPVNAQYLANALSFFTHAKYKSGIVSTSKNFNADYYISDLSVNDSDFIEVYRTNLHRIYTLPKNNFNELT